MQHSTLYEGSDLRIDFPSLWRIKVALALWVGGFFLPLAIPFVIGLPLSLATKTALSGLLVLGAPQLLTVIALALIGKSGFNYFKARLFGAAIHYAWRQPVYLMLAVKRWSVIDPTQTSLRDSERRRPAAG